MGAGVKFVKRFVSQSGAEQEHQRAEQAEALLAQERQQRELLAERLRAMGINPDELLG